MEQGEKNVVSAYVSTTIIHSFIVFEKISYIHMYNTIIRHTRPHTVLLYRRLILGLLLLDIIYIYIMEKCTLSE